ncbi:MAG: sigma-70 family RNA polymerase sigma factor, partial [Solirubrobacteraceae bacterium]
LLGDYHLAEDVAQEAFVEAHRALPQLKEPAAFGAWLRRIVFKHCDRFTRRKRPVTTGLDAAVDVASAAPSPHDVVETREVRRALGEAIATLSEVEQQAVLLYYMGDRSHSAIADFLGVTPNTVKTRLYSARLRLKRHMSDIEKHLDAARPSGDSQFAERVARMIRPPELERREPLLWSPGMGTDVWELFCACITGDLATVKRLVGADPSLVRAHYEYRTPLSFAVKENQIAVAAFLLEHGADALALGNVLEIARYRGYTAMVELLEREFAGLYGASPKGEPAAAAIRDRDRNAVRRLLDEQPELLHEGDARSSQPIHWAVMTRNLDVIDDLLARGANVDARRQDGALPIHLTNGDYHFRGWRDVPIYVTTTPDDVYAHLVA